MKNRFRLFIISSLGLVTLLAGGLGASFVFAHGQGQGSAQAGLTTSAKPASAHMVAMHVVNMQNVPAATPQPLKHRPVVMPLLTGASPAVYAQRKAAAAHNKSASISSSGYLSPKAGAYTPTAKTKFQGMADSASICPYFGGCEPPDMALATSSSWVFQGVNTSFAVYSPSGALQSGWPKNAQNFFGVPNPGSCDANGPFLSDPRAFYDPNDQRFWAAELQVEGAFGINSCPFLTRYWIAVSKTSDPRGLWNVYAFDMSLGTTNAADYTQFGFDGQAIYFSGNMFNQGGSAYEYAEVFGANKSTMEAGGGVSAFGFFDLTVGGVPVDTVQPMESQTHPYSGARAGLFINSFNIDSGGGQCSGGCSGLTVWAMANPGKSSDSLSGIVISSGSYFLAPNADEPGCGQCIETLDTRISGTPVYHNGFISFALETAVNNGSQIVPGIYWGQVYPTLNDNGAIAGAVLFQSGYYAYGGDGAASFGALMPDADGNLFMVFEFMNGSINPEAAYVARRATQALGTFHDNGFVLRGGDAPAFDSRWGDFEATSYDGVSKDNVWFAGQYSNAGGDWSTFIGKDKFSLSNP